MSRWAGINPLINGLYLYYRLIFNSYCVVALLDFRQIMDFLGGSSRVWAVENLFQSTLSQVVVVPGGSYRIITDALCELMDIRAGMEADPP